LSKYRRVRFI